MDQIAKSHAREKSHMFRFLGLVWAHPDTDVFASLMDPPSRGALAGLCSCLTGTIFELPRVTLDFEAFEAGYINLVEPAPGNRSPAALHAGDYEDLLGGRSRPEFMLDYIAWYKHFGLQVRDGDGETRLPDHISCQFEFLAWLAHLEEHSEAGSTLESGYRAAQRDFLERHVLPFLELWITRLAKSVEHCEHGSLFLALGNLSALIARGVSSTMTQICAADQHLQAASTAMGEGNTSQKVELWS